MQKHCVYKALLGTDIVYYGYTARPEHRFDEHMRAGQKLSGFSAKELLFAVGLRQENLSFEIISDELSRQDAQLFERALIMEHRPMGNETFARDRKKL